MNALTSVTKAYTGTIATKPGAARGH